MIVDGLLGEKASFLHSSSLHRISSANGLDGRGEKSRVSTASEYFANSSSRWQTFECFSSVMYILS